MTRKNQRIHISSLYLPERGELLAAAYELWLRAMNAPLKGSRDDLGSILVLHARSFRALLLDDVPILSAEMALDMAFAILAAIDAHNAPARYVAAGNVRSHLAKTRRDAATFWGSTPVYVLQAEGALRYAVDVLADSVLHDGLPLETAIDLTEPDRARDAVRARCAAAESQEAAA